MVEERQRLCPEEIGKGFFSPRDFLGDAEREGALQAAWEEPAAPFYLGAGLASLAMIALLALVRE